MENTFNLKKFLAEGKLLKEEYRMGIFDDIDADLIEEEDQIGYLEAIIKYCYIQLQDITKNDKYPQFRDAETFEKFKNLEENEGKLTPLQQYILNYEEEISGEDFANKELENIKKLNNISDVDHYYGEYRGWRQDEDFQYDLKNLIKDLKRKF